MPNRPAFEIGFVLAGAISAGCYSAGVMDFMIEALDDYYAERDKPDWDGPRHDVRVPVLAGASAGGMTSGIAALHMFRPITHVWPSGPVPPKPQNRLYSSWVTDISIQRLLETGDLEGDLPGLPSALCSIVLDEILANAFQMTGPIIKRPWVGRASDGELRVIMTLTNLRGVPYSFSLIGAGPDGAFGMLNHADIGIFRLGTDVANGADVLDVAKTDDPSWGFFKVATLATGAFPIGLKPRQIGRPARDYLSGPVGALDAAGRFVVIQPDGSMPLDGEFRFWSVDGGTINNEPLEQARRFLTGEADEESDGLLADKAVVLVAPFPSFRHLEGDTMVGTLASVLPGLAATLVNQARFKPEELAKAHDVSNFSRFIVYPERQLAGGATPPHAIASATLGGFSGFLDESFRRHDYLLGRRNAQAFLRWNLGLPKSHALFGDKEFPPKWIMREAGNELGTVGPDRDLALDYKRFALRQGEQPSETGYPIIPLTERMQQPIDITQADQPRPSSNMLDPLRPAIRKRVEKAVAVVVDVDLAHLTSSFSWVSGAAIKFAAKSYGTEVLNNKANTMIAKALEQLSTSFP